MHAGRRRSRRCHDGYGCVLTEGSLPGRSEESAANVLARLFQFPMHAPNWQRYPYLLGEAFLMTGVAILVPTWLDVAEVGFFSLFLAAAGLMHRFQVLLEENRQNIYVRKLGWRLTNGKTASSLVMLFFGSCAAYLVAGMAWSEDAIQVYFGFALDAAQIGGSNVLDRRFDAFGSLVFHNLMVMLSVFALCVLYRSYGALLALGWNACVWVFVLVTLVRRAIESTDLSGWYFGGTAALALVPHLCLEACAYVLAALAGIFTSRGIVRYTLSDLVFRQIMTAVAKLLVAGALMVLLAGLLESTVAPLLLSTLR
jgi:hypothetical protein